MGVDFHGIRRGGHARRSDRGDAVARQQDVGRRGPALEAWKRAGLRAARHGAHREAAGHFTRALELLRSAREPGENLALEVELLCLRGESYKTSEGYTSPGMRRDFLRAQQLSLEMGDASLRTQVLFGLWEAHCIRAEPAPCRAIGAETERIARELGDADALAMAHVIQGVTALFAGEPRRALEHLGQVPGDRDPEQRRAVIAVYGTDPLVEARCNEGIALWLRGHPGRALTASAAAVRAAEEIGDDFFLAEALGFRAALAYLLRRPRQVCRMVDRARGFRSFAHWEAVLRSRRGWALALLGEVREGRRELKRGLDRCRELGASLYTSVLELDLAELRAREGDPEGALALLQEALPRAAAGLDRFALSDLQRAEGELLARTGAGPGAAEAALRRALATAREQGARSFELRAATALARLWAGSGRPDEARELLAPVYAGLAGSRPTADLAAAGRQLSSLGGPPSPSPGPQIE